MQKQTLKTFCTGTFPLLLGLVLSLTGCRSSAVADGAAVRLPVKMVWAGHQCGGSSPTPSVQWLNSPKSLGGPGTPMGRVVEQAGLDWSRFGLVRVHMGQQRTGGYGLQLASSEATVREGVAFVSVQWRQPSKGAYVTQMITSPCLLLKMPRGGFRQIVVRDQDGETRARAQLPAAN